MASVSRIARVGIKAATKVNPTKVIPSIKKLAGKASLKKKPKISVERKLKNARLMKSAAGIGATSAMLIDNAINESQRSKDNILKNKKNAAKVKANAAKVKANKAKYK